MKKIFVLISLIFGAAHAHAATCLTLSSGASQSAIVNALNACGSGNTVVFGAGSYGPITSTVTIPSGVSMAGPAVPYSRTANQTAVINGSSSNGTIFGFQTVAGSSVASSVQYFEWNGQHPTNGGGFLRIVAGTTNFTATNNYIHGMNDPTCCAYQSRATNGVLLDGPNSTTTNKVYIIWNIFGTPSYQGDCSGSIHDVTGGSGGEIDNGGFCNGVGLYNNMTNVYINNNIFQFLEQGMKFYEGAGECNPTYIQYNDYSNIHRISWETQCNSGNTQPTKMYTQYNDIHSLYYSNPGSFGISNGNGCNIPSEDNPVNCESHADYNLVISETPVYSSYIPSAIEAYMGPSSTGNYNFIEGNWSNGIVWAKNGQITFNGNQFNLATTATQNCDYNWPSSTNFGYWGWEPTSDPPAYSPSCSGNMFVNSASGTITSVAPTISPASGTFTGSQVVTFTNPGANRDTNTGIWYTTDNSTPTPGSGTAKYTAGGGTITVTGTTTVKAVGMWGAANQPRSYAAGYGYVPSAMVGTVYTVSGASKPVTPTLLGAYLGSTGNANTIVAGKTLQFSAIGTYSDGSTATIPNSTITWSSSNPAVVSIASSGLVIGVAAGVANVQATIGTLQSSSSTVTVSGASKPVTPTLVSAYLGSTGSANTMVAGKTLQFSAIGTYSDGSTATIPNSTITWSSSNAAAFSIASSGLVTGVAAGVGNVQAKIGTLQSSPWTVTVSGASKPATPTLVSAYLGSTGSANTMVAGKTLQFSAIGTYSDGSTATIPNSTITWSSSNAAAFSIASSGLVTGVAAGVGNVQAKIGTLQSSPWTVTVSGASKPVTPTLVSAYLGSTGNANTMVAGKTLQFSAIGTYSDGSTATIPNSTITWSSSNAAAFSIASSGLVTGVAAGVGNVQAKIGTLQSSPSTVTVSGASKPVTPTLVSAYLGSTGNANTMVAGKTLQFSAIGTYSDGSTATIPNSTITWSSSNPAVVSIASSGLVIGVAAGVANVQATIGTLQSSSSTVTVSGASKPVTPTLVSAYLGSTGSANTMVAGKTLQFSAIGTYSDGSTATIPNSTITWSSSNAAAFSIASSGLVTGVAAGVGNVQAKIGTLQSSPWTVTVSGASKPATPTLVSAYLGSTGSANTMVAGKTLQFSAIGTYSDGSTATIPNSTITWSSSNAAAFSIASSGLVTGVAAGVGNVQAKIGTLQSSPWTVTVSGASKPVTPTLVSAYLGSTGNANTMVAGKTLQFSAIGTYSDGSTATIPNSTITWSSSNAAAFSIASSGLVTGVAAGVGNVQAKIGTLQSSPWTVTVSGASKPVTPTLVSAYLESTGNANTMVAGKTLQFSAIGTYSDGSTATIPNSTITWSSSNAAAFSIASSGLVTGVAAGVGNVQAKIGTLQSSPWTVTVSGASKPATPTLVSAYLGSTGNANTMEAGKTLQFSAIGTYSDGSTATIPNSTITWSSSNAAAFSIASSGLVTGAAAGVGNVQATIGTLQSSPWTVTVSGAPKPVTPTPTGNGTYSAIPSAPGSAIEDTFAGPFWETVAPAGGAASISDGHLFLAVPGGASHDALLPSNNSVRVVQAIGNDNFDISIKIDSQIVAGDANTSQGLTVISDQDNFITYALETDGTRIGLSAHTISAGTVTTVLDDKDFSQYQNPIYLRLTKSATAYVTFYSLDGVNWSQATSFIYGKVPTLIGPFAGNFNSNPANTVPVVMSVNWFHVQ